MTEAFASHVTEEFVGTVVEIGVGERDAVAEQLATEPHLDVIATDVTERSLDGPRFVRDDVTDPDPAIYRDASLVYALRPPPELHRQIARLADMVDAEALIVPFGNDTIPAPHRQIAVDGATVYRLLPPDE